MQFRLCSRAERKRRAARLRYVAPWARTSTRLQLVSGRACAPWATCHKDRQNETSLARYVPAYTTSQRATAWIGLAGSVGMTLEIVRNLEAMEIESTIYAMQPGIPAASFGVLWVVLLAALIGAFATKAFPKTSPIR
jgi:hypothetical protein